MQDTQNNIQDLRVLLRLFPDLNNVQDTHKLKIDQESLCYITLKEDALKITNIIYVTLKKLKIKNAVITDCTAGVGGDTISFGRRFHKVYAFELDAKRTSILLNNVLIYKLKNTQVFNGSCLEFIHKISDHNVVYVDPPWGGRDYKDKNKLRLSLSGIAIEDICNKLFNDKFMKKVPDIVVLKLPINYDLNFLYNKINNKNICYYNLTRMLIIVITKNRIN